MKRKNSAFKVGNSIKVKEGIKDPDSDVDLSDWQGRILETDETESGRPLFLVAWDSHTLRNMPEAFLEQSEEEGMDWQQYFLEADDVEFARERDTQKEVHDAVDEITSRIVWYSLGEEGKRIRKVLSGVQSEGEAFEAWKRFLEENLQFPFEAEVSEYQEAGKLRKGDRIRVMNITEVDDMYGIIVACKWDSREVDFPLCNLAVTGKGTNNRMVSDYAVWFENR